MKFQMLGDANKAGPVRLSDVYDSEVGGASTGIAASQKALYDAYNSLNSRGTRKAVTLSADSHGIRVVHYYNDYAHMIQMSGKTTGKLYAGTIWYMADALWGFNFPNYVPGWEFNYRCCMWLYNVDGYLTINPAVDILQNTNFQAFWYWV